MKKIIITSAAAAMSVLPCLSQSAIDGYRLSQPDMKGTARYMGMAGAFGALGGDLSAISLNPGGIGVYRNSDVGFTLDLDLQSANSSSQGMNFNTTQTKFLLNNIGGVLTLKLPSSTCPNLNFGFTFNRGTTYNRKYRGSIPTLYNSMSNYIAGIANSESITEAELATDRYYDPYNPSGNEYAPPWIAILGYDGYLITPEGKGGETNWFGQWGQGTSGSGQFLVEETGSTSDYNIVIGGNISNVLYWGMNFDIVNLNYSINAIWGENLQNAYVPDAKNNLYQTSSDWAINNIYNVTGTGFKYEIGVILKPIQELRLGLAFHTPTWYNLTESYGASLNYNYGGSDTGQVSTNNGILGYNNMSFRTPMKLIASAAAVIANSFILSFDYEWTPYNKMRFSEPSAFYGGGYYDWDYPYYDWWWRPAAPDQAPKKQGSFNNSFFESSDPYYYTNSDIENYYQATNTFKIGAEFRLTPSFSLRAGYANISSPVKKDVKENMAEIYTSGTLPSYRFDNETNYATGGIGWKYQHFYIDLAYVYKKMTSTYHAYTPDLGEGGSNYPSPQSKLTFNESQVLLTAGLKF